MRNSSKYSAWQLSFALSYNWCYNEKILKPWWYPTMDKSARNCSQCQHIRRAPPPPSPLSGWVQVRIFGIRISQLAKTSVAVWCYRRVKAMKWVEQKSNLGNNVTFLRVQMKYIIGLQDNPYIICMLYSLWYFYLLVLRGCSMATSILHSQNFRFQITMYLVGNWDFSAFINKLNSCVH
jgi:hypothetical protein